MAKNTKPMTKSEMIDAIAKKTGFTKKDAEKVVNATIDSITESLVKGDKVAVSGFGNFEVKTREARECRNPRTGETIEIAASKRPVFSAGSALKNSVN